MKSKYFLMVWVWVCLPFLGWVHGAIPASERAALIGLYKSTNGDHWGHNGGWKTPPLANDGFAKPGAENSWFGIAVDGDHVVHIYLVGENLRGCIPSALGNLSYLKVLNLATNHLSGNIPLQLANLSQLKGLSLGYNKLVGCIPSELGNLGQLDSLSLRYNQLGGCIPSELGNLNQLVELSLDHNQLTGNIPPQLGNLYKLDQLNLCSNKLKGSIPFQLGNLSQLVLLTLDNNQLAGSIPPTLGNLSKMSYLTINNNHLTGSIPSSLGNLTRLASLILNDNQLTGNIPSTLGDLPILIELILNNNYLSGPIPSTFSNLSHIYSLAMGYNCLYATDPGLRDWLNLHDPGWEVHQDHCSSALSEINPPFGYFDSPIDGSMVSGSIAVTGWTLDEGGVESVKIYLNQGDTPIFVGEALFVEGVRPDVAVAYPQYPDNTKAGWGYVMLTHFLPGGGNGTYVLSAVATGWSGKTTILGTKTIFVDNAHAVKPFGAIDIPTQGGMASGSCYINWGWVLTPQPNSIPTNGSTIDVWVDGVNKGHPFYNNCREDIAMLFPGYANSSGAVGYFYLDTTPYTSGVHTIQWTATDNVGNTDGIGSRYVTIQNAAPDKSQQGAISAKKLNIQQISTLPMDDVEPISVTKGFHADNDYQELLPDQNGNHHLVIKEMEPVTIQLGNRYADIQGYLSYGKTLHKLPIGSTLDKKNGTFSWAPGPGFLGSYSLVFVLTDIHGESFKKSIEIHIEPK